MRHLTGFGPKVAIGLVHSLFALTLAGCGGGADDGSGGGDAVRDTVDVVDVAFAPADGEDGGGASRDATDATSPDASGDAAGAADASDGRPAPPSDAGPDLATGDGEDTADDAGATCPRSCDDGDPCTEDRCDETSGACAHAVAVGEPCDDGNVCTTQDACALVGGEPRCFGAALKCADDDPCTADTCDPGAGCRFEPAPGAACQVEGACPGAGTCDADGACVPDVPCGCSGPDECGDHEDCVEAECVCRFAACGDACCAEGEICAGGACCSVECGGRECGPDARCGVTCGTCADEAAVCLDGGCCVPDCAGRECGTDGCGGICATCPPGCGCTPQGTCDCACVPDCAGRECGPDGCGGRCGTCAAGTVIETLDAPAYYGAGLAWDGTHLWLANVTEAGHPGDYDRVYRVDPASGAVVSSFAMRTPHGLAWDGSHLWLDEQYFELHRVTTDGRIVHTIPAQGLAYGLAYDPVEGVLWQTDSNGGIFKLDPADGSVLDVLVPDEEEPAGWADLAWDGVWLWHSNLSADTVYRLDPVSGTIVGAFDAPTGHVEGLTFDGEHLWLSDTSTDRLTKVSPGGGCCDPGASCIDGVCE